MRTKKAGLLNCPDIGEIISFSYDGVTHRDELRQISHDENYTYIEVIDPDYDNSGDYSMYEYVLEHDDVITFEER